MTDEPVRHRKRILRRSIVSNRNTNNHINNDSSSFSNNHYQQQRMLYARKKNDGLTCNICEGPAHGYNFDTITCESCKAFFRRNALKPNV
jgi:hypothetical protein